MPFKKTLYICASLKFKWVITKSKNMFKGHPKGLYVAFFTNMGERFGFYTMMAILVLFLQAKYGLSENVAGDVYSWFYFAIYALALVGGILADATRKYKTVIIVYISVINVNNRR